MRVKLTDSLTITSQDGLGTKTIELNVSSDYKTVRWRSQQTDIVFKSHLHCGMKYKPNTNVNFKSVVIQG